MKFVLEIDCGNTAFDREPSTECLRILKNAVARVEAGHTDGLCIDSNGNRVGKWYVEGLHDE